MSGGKTPETKTPEARSLRSVNPATEALLAEFPVHDGPELERRLAHSHRAAARNRKLPIADRTDGLRRMAEALTDEKARWSRLLTEEMGKPLAAAEAEVDKCALVCRYYADNAESFLADEAAPSAASSSRVIHRPLGTVLAVMPWNFPFWQVFRFAAPALAAGNVALLKHASNVPQAALAIEEIVGNSGLPAHSLQTLLIGPDRVADVLADDRVHAATVTGSSAAGQSVASIAGANAKKTVLELGGSDPFIVMPSADIDEAVRVGVHSRTLNNGQSCIGAKRFIVHASIYDDFLQKFADAVAALTVGDPMAADTDVGPLALKRGRERLDEQVSQLIRDGAHRVCGARPAEGPGYFYQPGILENIPRHSETYYDELFGPVALFFKARDIGAAIDIANDSKHGLASAIWTRDNDEAEHAIDRLQAGATFVNALVKSDPVLPFGGIKASGYGRELARDGMLEFVNRKTIYID